MQGLQLVEMIWEKQRELVISVLWKVLGREWRRRELPECLTALRRETVLRRRRLQCR